MEVPLPSAPADAPCLFSVTTAAAHYCKGLAAAALGDVELARQHQTSFVAAREAVPTSRVLHNVTCRDMLVGTKLNLLHANNHYPFL